MGYYVNILDSTAVIPKDMLDEAFKRLCAMNAPEMDIAKSGGSFTGGQRVESWYSWMSSDYDKTCKDAAEILAMMGFETEVAGGALAGSGSILDEGDLIIRFYDSKTGDEDLFLYALKDLFVDGSYIRWNGEDGAQWEHSFEGGQMFYRNGGWDPSPREALRARVFSYSFSPDRLHVDLVPATTPPTPEEQNMKQGRPALLLSA